MYLTFKTSRSIFINLYLVYKLAFSNIRIIIEDIYASIRDSLMPTYSNITNIYVVIHLR